MTRRDRGMTLVELTVVIAIVGVLSVALAGGIGVVLRSEPRIMRASAENHDQQQLINYFYADARSTAAVDTGNDDTLEGYTRATTADGCPGNVGLNVLQLTWNENGVAYRVSYRLSGEDPDGSLDRYACTGPDIAGLGAPTSLNIADEIGGAPPDWSNSGAPVEVQVVDNVATLRLYQSTRELSVSATLGTFSSKAATQTSTTVAPTIPTTTTTSTTTTSTTTTTVAPTTTTVAPGGTTGVCSLVNTVVLSSGAAVTPPAPVTPLLRDATGGGLSTPVRVEASLTTTDGISLLDVDLNDASCATVHLAYNTGVADLTVPMHVSAQCAVLDPESVCVGLTLSLSADLPADSSQPWTTGDHAAFLVGTSGTIAGSSATFTVADDPPTTTTTSTTTTLPPVTVPTSPAGSSVNPFAPSQGFAVISEGDLALDGTTVRGGVAAGGAATFRQQREIASLSAAAFSAPGESTGTGLLVNGALNWTSSSDQTSVAHGYAYIGDVTGSQVQTNGSTTHIAPSTATGINSSPRVRVTGDDQTDQSAHPVVRPDMFPFTNTFVLMNFYAAQMSALSPTTCADVVFPSFYKQGNDWVLSLTAGKVNVLNVTAKELEKVKNVNDSISPPTLPSSSTPTPLIINVTDQGEVSMVAHTWPHLQSGDHAAIIWNFPNATSLTVDSVLYGSLYAPNAALTLQSTQVYGWVVADSLTTSGGEIISTAFTPALPCLV